MRITIQAVVDREDGRRPVVVDLGAIERVSDQHPSSGLGLFVRETHDILLRLQSVVLQKQTALFLESATRCQGCGGRLATKTMDGGGSPALPRRSCIPRSAETWRTLAPRATTRGRDFDSRRF